MSGGYFEYKQWVLDDLADRIERLIETNECEELTAWGDKKGRFYSKETIKEFKNAVKILKKAATYAQRIDWLLSGDDGEESFHERLKEELSSID